MAQVDINLKTVVDLTAPDVQQHYGVTRESLTADDYRLTQKLANDLRGDKIEALWTYSRADQPHGRMLVVFTGNLRPGSFIVVKSLEKVNL